MSTAVSARGRGGGITKRGARVRVDRDGDLDMDGPTGRNKRMSGGPSRGRPRPHLNLNEAPKGPAADKSNRSASGSGMGNMRNIGGRSRGQNRPQGGVRKSTGAGPLAEVRVEGWDVSKGTYNDCIAFLERKTKMRFTKTQKVDNMLIIKVPVAKLQNVLDWDNALFAGVNLKVSSTGLIDMATDNIIAKSSSDPQHTKDTKATLKQVLANRYRSEAKVLDLSNLGKDPLLREIGFFELNSTTNKMFPALMLVADQTFTTPQAKRDAVPSVSLAYNNLKVVRPVSTLAPTFPDLRNLSLEGNLIDDWKALDAWRHRFRGLEQLVLIGNPITQLPGYREEAMRRWPNLNMLDNIPIERPAIDFRQEAASRAAKFSAGGTDAKGEPILPLSTQGNFSIDTSGITMQFLSTFFELYDTDREKILTSFYTPNSTFSISVNTSSPRVESENGQRQYWDSYIPLSRNLKRTSHGLIEKLATGTDAIRGVWNKLPLVKHDLSKPELWSFDCWPVDLSPGVRGMFACVHGEFDESNVEAGKVVKRSFDRSFMLSAGPDGSVKVVNDMYVVRSYGGHHSWQPEQNYAPVTNVVNEPDANEKRQKCQLFSEKSGLTLQYSEMCLAETKWDLEQAWVAFQNAKNQGMLGPEAYANPAADNATNTL